MLQFKAIEGQSLWDVCLQTYGTLNLMTKLLQDNNIESINIYPYGGQKFIWDETLSANQSINISSTNANIIYATRAFRNGNVLSVVLNGSYVGGHVINNDYYDPKNPINMIKYQKTSEVQYTAIGGETFVILPELLNATIIQVTREIKPLLNADYSLIPSLGRLGLMNGIVLDAGETLFIIYGKIITS
jgi:hypothetical protein